MDRISRYQIIRKIATGGMGEVYEAFDPQLDRKIALKVLPPEIARDPGRLQRFLREAKTASSLNHPAVIQIHEIAQDGDAHFISMEYVDGETLEARLAKGKLEIREAMRIALTIAEALQVRLLRPAIGVAAARERACLLETFSFTETLFTGSKRQK